MIEKADIETVLRTINDPELGIDIVNLGLVYEIRVSEMNAEILMTLTTPYCPLDQYFEKHIPEKLKEKLPELQSVILRFTFDPPWTQERIAPEARTALGRGHS